MPNVNGQSPVKIMVKEVRNAIIEQGARHSSTVGINRLMPSAA